MHSCCVFPALGSSQRLVLFPSLAFETKNFVTKSKKARIQSSFSVLSHLRVLVGIGMVQIKENIKSLLLRRKRARRKELYFFLST